MYVATSQTCRYGLGMRARRWRPGWLLPQPASPGSSSSLLVLLLPHLPVSTTREWGTVDMMDATVDMMDVTVDMIDEARWLRLNYVVHISMNRLTI